MSSTSPGAILRKKALPTLLLAAFIVIAPSASAQQNLRDRDPDIDQSKSIASSAQNSNFKFGSFYLDSRLRISDAGLTDISMGNHGLPTGPQQGISLMVQAPQRLYYVPYRKTIFSAELIPGYTFLDEGDKQGQFDWSARGDAHFLFNHLYLDLYTLLSNRIRPHVGDINRLATVKDRENGIAGEFKYSSRTSSNFALRQRKSEYPTDRFQPEQPIDVTLFDRDETNARVTLNHKTFPLTSLFVAAEGSDYTFDRLAANDSRRRTYSAGAIYDNGRTFARLEAGPATLDFDNTTRSDYSGMTGSLRVTRKTDRLTYGGGLTRDLGFSIMLDNPYYESTIANASISYMATRRITLRAGSTFERDEFPEPVLGNQRIDEISFTSAGVGYSFSRFTIGADVGWYERDSTYGGDQDSGIRWGLALSLTL